MYIKPIETEYNGYRFRSRLEARWAVFFDAMHIEYDYEPEGFVGFDGSKYLPDFYLPAENLYVEVKGSDEQLESDWDKLACAIDYNSTPVSNGLLILGKIPNPKDEPLSTPVFSYLWWNEGVTCDYAAFSCDLVTGTGKVLRGMNAIHEDLLKRLEVRDTRYRLDFSAAGCEMPGNVTTCERLVCDMSTPTVCQYYVTDALERARQARFEYGEKPTVR